jgi:hypothetical protein
MELKQWIEKSSTWEVKEIASVVKRLIADYPLLKMRSPYHRVMV